MEQKKVLTAEDLVIGGKYVPHQKTAGDSLKDSYVWEKAQKQKQPFLYYIGFYEHPDCEIEENVHLFCHEISEQPNGDFFNPEDVTPYIEPKNETLEDARDRMAYQAADWQDFEDKKGNYIEPIEEVSDGITTLDEAANNYASYKQVNGNLVPVGYMVDQLKAHHFKSGANWQKEQGEAVDKEAKEIIRKAAVFYTSEDYKKEAKGSMYMPTRDKINKSIFNDGVELQKEQTKALQEDNEQLRKMHNIALEKYQSIQESHDKLLEALEMMYNTSNPYDVVSHKKVTVNNEQFDLGEFHVSSCGIPSNEAIHKAKNAIENAKNYAKK